jgi:formylmethanofuran dehydrogenase subunit C
MSLELTLHTAPEAPLEAETICPDRLSELSARAIAELPVQHGNRDAKLGDFFRIAGEMARNMEGEIRLGGDFSRVKLIGAGMTRGRIVIEGDAGMHLGAGMSGGEIVVQGHAGDWVGPEMSGGRIVVKGNSGHLAGAAVRGAHVGIQGGEIVIHGNAGNEVGSGMRRGLIAIGGDCGDFTGVNMLAGTIIVLGRLGWRTGAGMKRGSIISMHQAELLPTFSYACTYAPSFLRLYLGYVRQLGLPVNDSQFSGLYRRFSGDAVETNQGEILLFAG